MTSRPASTWPDDKSHVRSTTRPRPSTADIAEVLARSQSRKEAATALGIPATTLERLCREQALVAAYEAVVERGSRHRGGGKKSKNVPMRRWSFFWRVSEAETVCIWPGRELEAVTEKEALDVFMTKVAKCMANADIVAVEQVGAGREGREVIRVFLAAPLAQARHASVIAGALRASFEVTSTWHDGAGPKDPRDDDARLDKLSTNLAAIDRSDVLVALLNDGEPRCTFFEIGYAVARVVPVVCVHDSGTGRFLGDSHALAVRLDLRHHSLEDLPRAIETAFGLVGGTTFERPTMPAPAPEAIGGDVGVAG